MQREIDTEYKPFSTLTQVDDFILYSPIWKDMQMELKIWLSEIHLMLENLDGKLSHRDIDRLGGSAEAIRNLSNFPDVLLTNAKDEKRVEKINKS